MMDSPGPVILGIVAGSIVLLLIIIAMIVHKKKSVASNDSENQQSESKSIQESSNMLMDNQQIGMSIKFEEFSTLTEEEETHLVEIHDKKFLARIGNAIPGTLQAIANTGAIHNYNQAIRSAGQLYRAVIPQDAALVNSRSLEGAFRGFYRGKNNIRGQANLIPVDGNMGKGLATMGVVNTAMSIASMVVGQYYMSLISNKLDTISNSLKQIAEFQDNEYTGKVYTLIAEVQKCAIFKAEIIGNDELRNQELAHLKDLEHECAELLSQANITLQGFAKKSNSNYADYEKTVVTANRWYQFQQVLLSILGKIGELTYALNLGAVSKDYCHAMYIPFAKQAENALHVLNEWHINNTRRLEIDTESTKRKRQGIEGFFMKIPAIFNNDLNYKEISKQTATMITQQTLAIAEISPDAGSDYFKDDVELVIKDGKLYYLPPTDDKQTS